MKNIRTKKVWTDAYGKVSKQLDDLEVLNEFHEAGDATEEELDREYLATAKSIEELEFKKRLKLRILGLVAIEKSKLRQRSRITWIKKGDANTKETSDLCQQSPVEKVHCFSSHSRRQHHHRS